MDMRLVSILIAGSLSLSFPLDALATWSVLAVNQATHRLAISTATCVSQSIFAGTRFKTLADIQAVVVPGAGVAAAQALADPTGADQALIRRGLGQGTRPESILRELVADKGIQTRQFGILDVHGNAAGFTGAQVPLAAMHVQGRLARSHIAYSIQGNTLRSDAVVRNAERAFERTRGDLAARVLAAMAAGDAAGGDRRCSTTRTALIAYLLIADPGSRLGGDGRREFFYVTDKNLRPGESVDPVVTLRARYDARASASHR